MPSSYQIIKRNIIFNLLESYPSIPTRSLARIAYRDYPEFFKDSEEARRCIRVYTGKGGKSMRERIKMRKYYKP